MALVAGINEHLARRVVQLPTLQPLTGPPRCDRPLQRPVAGGLHDFKDLLVFCGHLVRNHRNPGDVGIDVLVTRSPGPQIK